MLEYLFFDSGLAERFVVLLRQQGVTWERREGVDGISVLVDEDVSDELLERLEQAYDELLDQQRHLVDIEDAVAPDAVHRVGVQYTGADGRAGQVRLDPELVARVLRGISVEELQQLVQCVADDIASGGSGRPLCDE